jgi:hypothetical protein
MPFPLHHRRVGADGRFSASAISQKASHPAMLWRRNTLPQRQFFKLVAAVSQVPTVGSSHARSPNGNLTWSTWIAPAATVGLLEM